MSITSTLEGTDGMTSKEREEIYIITKRLDEAVGRLIVPASKDPLVKSAMEIVSSSCFLLGRMID